MEWTHTRRKQLSITLILLTMYGFAAINNHFWQIGLIGSVIGFVTVAYTILTCTALILTVAAMWFLGISTKVPSAALMAGREAFFSTLRDVYSGWKITWDYVLAWFIPLAAYLTGHVNSGIILLVSTMTFIAINLFFQTFVQNLELDDELKSLK